MTWYETWFTISGTDGFTLPGMMEDPGTAGSVISDNPARGVELPHLGRADRNVDGVKKCILHAVWHAQGKGCSPGSACALAATGRLATRTPRSNCSGRWTM